MSTCKDLTVVLPVKNEIKGLKTFLPDLISTVSLVVVVDDGSSDGSGEFASSVGAKVVRHNRSRGNGAAVKSGILEVKTKYVGLMDGDGQHSVLDIVNLYNAIVQEPAELVVGARNGSGQANVFRFIANNTYNMFASWMVGERVQDLTSGQRIFRTDKIKNILWMLPNTFSYPTTSTMIFYRLGYAVSYRSIDVSERIGASHISPIRDGFRFLLIIMKVGTLFSPFKLFVPLSVVLFLLGLIRYAITYTANGTFTNMSALLFVSSIIVFLMGVLSEQISLAIYAQLEKKSE